MEVRKYLSDLDFCEVETPLIKSTPEGVILLFLLE
jgi:aspartyl-tRNA synthetase